MGNTDTSLDYHFKVQHAASQSLELLPKHGVDYDDTLLLDLTALLRDAISCACAALESGQNSSAADAARQ